jgi:hypothetical protein
MRIAALVLGIALNFELWRDVLNKYSHHTLTIHQKAHII